MSIWISCHFAQSIPVAGSRQSAWALVADVPRSAANIPELVTCTEAGKSSQGLPLYEFRYKQVGIERWHQDPWHKSAFILDQAAWQIDWSTAEGDGNIRQSGRWVIEEQGNHTVLHLTVDADMELPVPKLLKMTAQPFVRKIFMTRMEEYTQNIARVLREQ